MKRVMRWIAYAVGTLVVLLGGAAGYVYAASNNKATQVYEVPLQHVAVPTDPATIARGKHLSTAIAKCVECHQDDLGGKVMIDDPALGMVVAPNITSGAGTAMGGYTDDEIVRLIRHGVKRDGRSVMIMPAEEYQHMVDADVAAIVAYLRSVPAVDRAFEPTQLRALGRTLVATNVLPIYGAERVDHARTVPAEMMADTSLSYGEYLANIGGCTGCHGPGLGGGPIPGMPPETPPASNLTPTGLAQYSDEQVEVMMRTGKRPDGSQLRPEMPWRYTALMTPLEMRATIKYLRSVPGKEFGSR